MKEYGKWTVSIYHHGVEREVKHRETVLRFVREWTTKDYLPVTIGADRYCLCRVLNGEPEPEVKLDEQMSPYMASPPFTYRFSTAQLEAELKRRKAESPALTGQITVSGCTAINTDGVIALRRAPPVKVKKLKPKKPAKGER